MIHHTVLNQPPARPKTNRQTSFPPVKKCNAAPHLFFFFFFVLPHQTQFIFIEFSFSTGHGTTNERVCQKQPL